MTTSCDFNLDFSVCTLQARADVNDPPVLWGDLTRLPGICLLALFITKSFYNHVPVFWWCTFPCFTTFDLKCLLLQAPLWLCGCWHLLLCRVAFSAMGTSETWESAAGAINRITPLVTLMLGYCLFSEADVWKQSFRCWSFTPAHECTTHRAALSYIVFPDSSWGLASWYGLNKYDVFMSGLLRLRMVWNLQCWSHLDFMISEQARDLIGWKIMYK